MPGNEITIKDYIQQGFKSLDDRLQRVEDQQRTFSDQISKLATREELEKAITDGTGEYRTLRGMFWTACVAGIGCIGWLAKLIWDLVPHQTKPAP